MAFYCEFEGIILAHHLCEIKWNLGVYHNQKDTDTLTSLGVTKIKKNYTQCIT